MGKRMKCVFLLTCVLALCGCGNAGDSRVAGGNKVEDAMNAQIAAADAQKEADAATRTGSEDETNTVAGMESEDEANAVAGTGSEDEAGETAGTGSGDEAGEAAGTEAEGKAGASLVDIDLTKMSSDMVYSTVYQMISDPDSYAGKTVKMGGKYYATWYEQTGQYYYYVMIADAAACCSQGLEFVWGDGSRNVKEYPQDGEELEVVGVFETYDEEVDGKTYTYCHLRDAEILGYE